MNELEINLFKIHHNNVEPKHGRVLVSGPFLHDMYFSRSVIFLTEHNNEGTVGFVLNKAMKISMEELISGFPDFDARISLGGPVSTDTIHFLHCLGKKIPNSVKVFGNIYWGGDFETVKKMVVSGKIDKSQIRFFVGYSGWSANQLEREISENSWIVTELDEETIMNNSQDVWTHTLQSLGDKYKLWANFPENPGMN